MNIKTFQGAAPGNPASEAYDAFRMTLREEQARQGWGSVAAQVERDIKQTLNDGDADMEPLFVY